MTYILNSKRSDECINFTKMCLLFFFFCIYHQLFNQEKYFNIERGVGDKIKPRKLKMSKKKKLRKDWHFHTKSVFDKNRFS